MQVQLQEEPRQGDRSSCAGALSALQRELASLSGRLDEARARLDAREHELASLRQDLAEVRADYVALAEARQEDVVTLCAALELAERARAVLTANHEAELELLRAALEPSALESPQRVD